MATVIPYNNRREGVVQFLLKSADNAAARNDVSYDYIFGILLVIPGDSSLHDAMLPRDFSFSKLGARYHSGFSFGMTAPPSFLNILRALASHHPDILRALSYAPPPSQSSEIMAKPAVVIVDVTSCDIGREDENRHG